MAVAAVLLVAGAAAFLRLAPVHGLAFTGGYVYRGKAPAQATVHVRASAWCGTDAAADDRLPDAASGQQVHVIYAIPSDGADRFASLAPAIATDLSAVDAWWRSQDPTRTLRFDLYAFPGCAPGLGRLDLSRVQLSQPTSYYAPLSTRGSRLVLELDNRFADPSKKYLVYYDAPVEEPRVCGQSTLNPDEGGRYAYSLVYAQACFADIGAGSLTASVATHELAHNLGAVPSGGPPHACAGDAAHVCDNDNDLMFPYTHGQGLGPIALDVGRDDYYGHSGAWWDLQDSPWLAHLDTPQFPLAVSLGGSGAGTVRSDLPGIACPPACSASWDQGSKVQLTAAAGENTRFVGWSGACSSDPCVVTMNAAQSVVARFAAQVQLTISVTRTGEAAGTVTSRPAGISCPGTCVATFDEGTPVRLVATPGKGAAFAGWGGACAGKTSCSVAAGSAPRVTASFAPAQPFVPPMKKDPLC